MKFILVSILLILVYCETSFCMSETEIRKKLADAGITLWAANVEEDAYKPPYSFLKPLSNNLFRLYLRNESISDISVLAKMPISNLYLDTPKVKDLTPLARMPLTDLRLICCSNADISPIRGKPLVSLGIDEIQVPDLSVIKGMPLKDLWFNPDVVTNGMDVIATMPKLEYIYTGQRWSMKSFTKRLQLWGFRSDSKGKKPETSDILNKPISIRMTTYTGFTSALPWELIILPSGEAYLQVNDNDDSASEKRTTLTVDQMNALRKCIITNEYFSLPTVMGDNVVDASSRSLSIRVGDYQHSITIQSLINRLVSNDPQLVVAKKAVAIWKQIGSMVKVPKNYMEFISEDQSVMDWKMPNISR